MGSWRIKLRPVERERVTLPSFQKFLFFILIFFLSSSLRTGLIRIDFTTLDLYVYGVNKGILGGRRIIVLVCTPSSNCNIES